MTNTKQTQNDKTIQPFNCSTIQRVKAYAFTLAETLIVIGIIGVVAALTLPNLNHATGDKERITKVKKAYSSLTDAFDRAQAIYGDFDTWFTDLDLDSDWRTCNERFAKRVTEFMKVSKNCGFNDDCGENFYPYEYYMSTLADGTSIGFNLGLGRITPGRITVDIDGPRKGKNYLDEDIFEFGIDKDVNGIYMVIPERYIGFIDDIDMTEGGYSIGTMWIIQNDNMDYLKCPGDLDWDTHTSCDNPKTKNDNSNNNKEEEEDDDMDFSLFD